MLSDTTSRPVDHPSNPTSDEYQLGSRRKQFRRTEMKQLGVFKPSESPWAAPVVLVRRRDGTLHRLTKAEPGHTEIQLSLAQCTRLLG